MGWLRYLFLGDLGQRLDLSDQQAEIESLKQQFASRPASPETQNNLAVLQKETDELKLYLAAVLRLLVAKNVVSADEIRSLVDLLDREDDKADRKYEGDLAPNG